MVAKSTVCNLSKRVKFEKGIGQTGTNKKQFACCGKTSNSIKSKGQLNKE
jgi:hypothetical protein